MIVPVILSGGSGTRLWPTSRASRPKQFARLAGDETMLQASALRLSGPGFAPPVVVTNADFRFVVAEQLREAGIEPSAILLEPVGRNTGPAVLAAAFWLAESDPDALMLVAPSDHSVADVDGFRAAVEAGVAPARDGKLVTFGVRPDRPETGYGYLEVEAAADRPNGDGKAVDGVQRDAEMGTRRVPEAPSVSGRPQPRATPLTGFVEKPGLARAREMLSSGRYFWNAGIFLFSASRIVAAFETHAPRLVEPIRRAVSGAREDLDFLRLDPVAWSGLDGISIDRAVMERADSDALVAVPLDVGWSDLGDWEAVRRELDKDSKLALRKDEREAKGRSAGSENDASRGVVADGAATAIDCADTLLRSEDPRVEIVGLGLRGIVAVATPDAVLVADASRAQEVRAAVAELEAKGASQASGFPVDHRPWGWFESLGRGDKFQVKRIHVKAGAALSLQTHRFRSEHWVVVEGTALVTVGEETRRLQPNESVYIPAGTRHRLENPGAVPMILIEVQTGNYLGEDDIVRHEDAYGRLRTEPDDLPAPR